MQRPTKKNKKQDENEKSSRKWAKTTIPQRPEETCEFPG